MLRLVARFLDYIIRLDTATAEFVAAVRTPLATTLLTSVTGLGSATAALCFPGVCYLGTHYLSDTVAGVCLGLPASIVAGRLLVLLAVRTWRYSPHGVTNSSVVLQPAVSNASTSWPYSGDSPADSAGLLPGAGPDMHG